jgi:hypothetical protein
MVDLLKVEPKYCTPCKITDVEVIALELNLEI